MIFQRQTDGDKWADYSFPGYVYTVGQVFYKKSLSRKGYRLFLSLRVFHGNMFLLNSRRRLAGLYRASYEL